MILLVIAVLAISGYPALFPAVPKATQVGATSWLDQGWTSDQREKYYRVSQGSLIIPYSWFLSLERPETGNHELFSTPENLARYGLVPDPSSKFNPDHLPVGLVKEVIPDDYLQDLGCGDAPCRAGLSVHREWLSYTCAACHTSRVTYKGKTLGVDGGRGRWTFTDFNTTFVNLLLVTSISPGMYNRFAPRVFRIEGRPDTPTARTELRKGLREFLFSPAVFNGYIGLLKHTYPTAEGFGRMDALGRGANEQFIVLDKRNALTANAPVVIPPLWYTHDYDWVQTVAAIRQPLGRNITESWGVVSAVDLIGEKRFATTIPMRDMFWMETLISVLRPPTWPEQVLGRIDKQAAELGRYLYEEKVFDGALTQTEEQWCVGAQTSPGTDGWQPCPNPNTQRKGLCARCHAPVTEVYVNEFGKRYLQLPMYKLDVIGTDPADAVNFNTRQVYTGALRAQFGGKERVGIGEALLTTTTAIMTRGFDFEHIPLDQRAVVTGFRKNNFRAPLAYPARPLQGYWATPPYLHNGAVPNLYELFSPANERSATFWTGSLEFDPVHVGYQSQKFEGGFEFRTRRGILDAINFSVRELIVGRLDFSRDIAGNSNLGHEFRNAPRGTKGVIGPYLSPTERLAIIEYMKVMPKVKPWDGGEELRRRMVLLKDMEHEYEAGSSPTAAIPRPVSRLYGSPAFHRRTTVVDVK